jgi:hypothetical protein
LRTSLLQELLLLDLHKDTLLALAALLDLLLDVSKLGPLRKQFLIMVHDDHHLKLLSLLPKRIHIEVLEIDGFLAFEYECIRVNTSSM